MNGQDRTSLELDGGKRMPPTTPLMHPYSPATISAALVSTLTPRTVPVGWIRNFTVTRPDTGVP